MKTIPIFTQEGAWSGGFYELTLELPSASKLTIKTALQKLWDIPALEGCYLHSDIEPSNQNKLSPNDSDYEGHLFGIATFPNRHRTCCGNWWNDFRENGCWFSFYLPLGSLGRAYPIGFYPFYVKEEPSPETWIKDVNGWLVRIAMNIYKEINFKVAFIGYEVDFFDNRETLKYGVPDERWDGILIPIENELIWYPPTVYKQPYVLEKRLR